MDITNDASFQDAPPPEAPEVAPDDGARLLAALEHLLFRLRSYQDNGEGEYALGVEAGMLIAAEMIENLLQRSRENDCGSEI